MSFKQMLKVGVIVSAMTVTATVAYHVVVPPNPGVKLAECSVDYYLAATMAEAQDDEENRIYYGTLSVMASDRAEQYLTTDHNAVIIRNKIDRYEAIFQKQPDQIIPTVQKSVAVCDQILDSKPNKHKILLTLNQ